MRKGFTLVEALIVIGVVAVLAVVVMAIVNPAAAMQQARDATRISDVNTINKAVDVARTDLLPLGTANTIYVSIPDTSPTCANLGLPMPPAGYSYSCVTATNLLKTDGTGWIPVNFAAASAGAPISKLPIDPTNQTSSKLYYIYVPSGMTWSVAANSFESAKQVAAYPSGLSLGTGPAVVWPTITYTGTGACPNSIAFDGTNMWTANEGGDSVTKISPTGAMTTYGGIGTGGSATAFGIAFNSSTGDMWVAAGNGGIAKVSPAGTVTNYTGTYHPYAIAFDGTNMWATGSNVTGNGVTKISPTGAMTFYTFSVPDPYTAHDGIAFDGTNMWAANNTAESEAVGAIEVSPAGVLIASYSSGTANFSLGIAFDGTNMWTTNESGNGVTKISPAGTITTYTGTGAGPTGIAFDGTNMWVTNYGGTNIFRGYSNGSSSVTEITPAGIMTTFPLATGTYPAAIAFDGSHNMWTANCGNNSVTKITIR